MQPSKQRISLTALLAIAVSGLVILAVLYALFIPTMRAREFAELVRSGQQPAALAMVPNTLESIPYQNVLSHAQAARLEPLTLTQLLRGERRVIVGQGWGGGDAEFVIGFRSITCGRNWFHVW